MFETNEVLQKLPGHLKSLIIEQPYNDYTAQDHAVWRYVMRQNIHYLKDVAHESYSGGLEQTGISIDTIPHMYGMNRILREIGWAAVAVDGFIPPAAFMEFQAYNVLVIAADIRPIDQIGYTPAPDIIHEAAGHAPIIANPEYAEYLRLFGQYGCKALSNPYDKKIYQAIRHLSILKADPYTKTKDIDQAEIDLEQLIKQYGKPSEISLIRNLHWWTVEYGLIGELTKPKIYGAGLLSSISECKNALKDSVQKIEYNINAKDYSFDITCMQPQLFVTPNFQQLTDVLEEFVDGMALRTGGLSSIQKAICSENIACCEYDTGVQINGTFTNVISPNNQAIYLQTTGPTSLSYKGKEITGHHKDYHKDGFSSPIGKVKGIDAAFELLTEDELNEKGIVEGQTCGLEFESGIKVNGLLRKVHRQDCKILLLSFENCTVKFQEQVLFKPEWGTYDMLIGNEIVSVFNGPADPESFGYYFPVPEEKTHKIEHTEEAKKLHSFYQKTRDIRELKASMALSDLYHQVKKEFPDEWLLFLEISELFKADLAISEELKNDLKAQLQRFKDNGKPLKTLVEDGLKILG